MRQRSKMCAKASLVGRHIAANSAIVAEPHRNMEQTSEQCAQQCPAPEYCRVVAFREHKWRRYGPESIPRTKEL
jgi:hypothetical protein